MTLPHAPSIDTLPPAAPPAPIMRFPLAFLMENASAPLQYRSMRDVVGFSGEGADGLDQLAYTFPPAIALALSQAPDGTWNESMLTVPSGKSDEFKGVGTVHAVRRLLEYGWDRESPPLVRARRVLFRLLAEDDDPALLYELAGKGKLDSDQVANGRLILREAAAATLAQAGYEADPRLRGAARRILDRIVDYLNSPLSRKPWMRVGNKQVLPPEAAPPSIHALMMLAYMPLFRSEHHALVDRIYQHVTQSLPRQESAQLIGKRIVAQPHLVLGDLLPHRNALDGDVPWGLYWLELMARLQFLKRNDSWMKLFDRMIDDMDRGGVWHPHKGLAVPRSSNSLIWAAFPLESASAGEERWTDATFRIGLIARLLGYSIELI